MRFPTIIAQFEQPGAKKVSQLKKKFSISKAGEKRTLFKDKNKWTRFYQNYEKFQKLALIEDFSSIFSINFSQGHSMKNFHFGIAFNID